MKIKFLSLVYSRHFSFLLSKVRTLHVLKMLRRMPEGRFKRLAVQLLDPNTIRKRIRVSGDELTIEIKLPNSTTMEIDLNDHVGYQLFMGRRADELAIRLGAKLAITANDVFLDIGANIGIVSIPVAKAFGCEVIAIEASKTNASRLMRNLSLNQVKCEVHNVAVLSRQQCAENFVPIHIKPGNTGANSIYRDWNSGLSTGSTEWVKTSTLDKLISEQALKRIKLIKLDIEGSETLALKGFNKISKVESPILFEYRIDRLQHDLNVDGTELLKILGRYFVLHSIELTQRGEIQFGNFDQRQPADNVIGLPKISIKKYSRILEL